MTIRRVLSGTAGFLILAAATSSVSPAFADGDLSEGTIKKVDVAAGKVTIKHGPLDNLEMPPMTLVFAVLDPTLLESFTPGDEIEFVAADDDGRLMITTMRANN